MIGLCSEVRGDQMGGLLIWVDLFFVVFVLI